MLMSLMHGHAPTGEREYFLEAMSYDDRVSWVDAIKQAAMRATEDKVVYNAGGSLYTEPMEEEDGGDTPLPEDIVDVAELWPAIYNKLGVCHAVAVHTIPNKRWTAFCNSS